MLGFVSGALGSISASGWSSAFGSGSGGMIAFGALAGGICAELSGGNFFKGFLQGGIVAGLNHGLHKMSNGMGLDDDQGPGPKKKFPKFKTIRDNYPKDNPDGTHAKPSKDGYINQCTIRVGYALEESGVDISSYDSTNQSSEGYPRWSRGFAMWLRENYGEPIIRTQEHFDLYWKNGAQGLIYLAPPAGSTVGHIDIIYGGGKTGSGYYSASEVWYWPIK